ncbi:DUF6879 family protein [Streptacidiphilus sp. PAMC 29251]
MTQFITDEQFDELFRSFEHTAWRWEAQRGYDSDRHTDAFQVFLAGGDPVRDTDRPWPRNIRAQTRAGKRIERVRVLDDPPTEGQRFLLTGAPYNIASGEDIRHLSRLKAEELHLPTWDFWLFDACTVLRLHFDDQEGWLGAERIEDPVQVLAACQVRDAAWHFAIPHEEYIRVGTFVM